MKSKWLSKISKAKYADFYKKLLSYMFEKFELASDEDEDVAFDMLGWDLDVMDEALQIGINNGYSLDLQLSLSKYAFNKEMGIEKIQSETDRKNLEIILEQYSKGNPKNT